MFLSAVTTKVQAAPTVIEKVTTLQPIIQQAPAVSPDVLALSQILALAGAGVLASYGQQFLFRVKNKTIQRLVALLVAAVVSIGAAFLMGDLKLTTEGIRHSIEAFLIILGSSQGRYQLFKLLAAAAGYQKVEKAPAAPQSDDDEVILQPEPIVPVAPPKAGF